MNILGKKHPSADTLKQEFENFHVSNGSSEIFSPGVHAVFANQIAEAWAVGMSVPIGFDLILKDGNLLGILENRQP